VHRRLTGDEDDGLIIVENVNEQPVETGKKSPWMIRSILSGANKKTLPF
jgi:hypothetical protein